MNRDSEEAVLDREFLQQEPPPRSIVTLVNYTDNPYDIPELIEMAEHCKAVDFTAYQHIWLGGLNNLAKTQVLAGKWRTEKFETPEDAMFYHGADWSNGGSDPHTLVRSFVEGNTLYIDWEMKKTIDKAYLPDEWERCPTLEDSRLWTVYCDEARPDLIQDMSNFGYKAKKAAKNWQGTKSSIQAGIDYLRSFDEIVIHDRCKETIKEAKNWKWKTDPRSGDVVPILIDKHNHIMDALRYSHVEAIKRSCKTSFGKSKYL